MFKLMKLLLNKCEETPDRANFQIYQGGTLKRKLLPDVTVTIVPFPQ